MTTITPEQHLTVFAILAVMIISIAVIDHANSNDSENGRFLRDVETVVMAVLRAKRQRDGEEEEEHQRKKRTVINYDHQRAAYCVYTDYWGPHPRFRDRQFERTFRITKACADRLLQVLATADPFFTQKEDALGRQGICPKVKVLIALKTLAYGCSVSAFIDYFQMGETTARECLKRFARAIAGDEVLKTEFRRPMNRHDAQVASELHERKHGIAGMIGSLDCMHCAWRLCPMAWQGHFKGAKGRPTIVLEALVDHNLWFWHTSFGHAGTQNDLNIWEKSSLLKSFLDGTFTNNVDFEFGIGGTVFNKLWIMVDGIYPELARFVKPIKEPVTRREGRYAKWQEASRKDVERGFGVLQRKFQIITRPFELWFALDIDSIVNCCITLHNMMVRERMRRYEAENEGWYEHHAQQEDPEADEAIDQAEEEIRRIRAELDLLHQLDQHFNVGPAISAHERARQDLLRLTHVHAVVQRRWEQLYDVEGHFRLRDAIVDELENNYGHEPDSDDSDIAVDNE